MVAITVYQGSPTASLRISLNNAHHLLHNQELKKISLFCFFFFLSSVDVEWRRRQLIENNSQGSQIFSWVLFLIFSFWIRNFVIMPEVWIDIIYGLKKLLTFSELWNKLLCILFPSEHNSFWPKGNQELINKVISCLIPTHIMWQLNMRRNIFDWHPK